ncbi:MAG: HTH domain-containing protein [Bacteroidales bacterium]
MIFFYVSGNAGTTPEIAEELGISVRTVMSYFKQLNKIKVPVVYDCTFRTWKYSRSGRLVLCFIEDESNSPNQNTNATISSP